MINPVIDIYPKVSEKRETHYIASGMELAAPFSRQVRLRIAERFIF